MSDTLIFAISLGVTLLGLVLSWGVARRRGAASGMRGAALSLLPLAAALTGATEFFVTLAFSPVRWAGAVVAGLAVLLYVVSGAMLSRRAGREAAPATGAGGGKPAGRPAGKPAGKQGRAQAPAPRRAVERREAAPALDDDMAEIEEILRNRGIK
ncbi:hypothetical protein GCM10009678_76480 [Actinomadura kijaniata]|uniref:Cellulose synthase n=1 Tax=Actinomadura namibiensis TaxID=182080 RepID=A0A7W3LW73_ACTNM|nr:hypothetical protein [Actinomadura namibiensis]MBA8955389.1 hypothetical protein [Actinomadura namibiensis]